ncbi:hypothetical protein ACFY78_42285 [Streptomyces olindensis]|uniref:hypothetical protein n=1 Tax=Streptomyces olindensis TaxID=358823 RepID=UPI0036AEF8A6
MAWYVIERRTPVRWGAPQELEQVVYELIVLYFDTTRRLLYIHGSEKSSTYKDLAEAVLGEDCELINGKRTFRVLARLDRLVPTNVGLKDARDYFTRFSLHVGSDVSQGFTTAQEHKSQTHIATSGFDDGDSVSISVAHSGRFWSPTTAPSLKAWTDWCDQQGTKLLDSAINLEQLFDGFIIPEDRTAVVRAAGRGVALAGLPRLPRPVHPHLRQRALRAHRRGLRGRRLLPHRPVPVLPDDPRLAGRLPGRLRPVNLKVWFAVVASA